MKPFVKHSEGPAATYAVASDFCRIFAEEMGSLYQLSFALTGDAATAEQCFVSGLEDCAGSNRVFRDWARSWARRTIIRNAIRVVHPVRKQAGSLRSMLVEGEVRTSNHGTLLSALFALPVFERFVFVMSVLEGLSDHDCQTLLDCTRRDIVRARAKAMIGMANSTSTPTQEIAAKAGALFTAPSLLPQNA